MKELELFSLDGLGSIFGRNKHNFVLTPGQKCLNCDTELAGRYCHVCGQDADTHHRTIFHLVFEAFEGLFHVDGRLWQTLPPLFFAPGKLARDLMEGRVTRHVPPFRIFLIALLVFMFVAEHKTEEARHHPRAVQSQDIHQSMADLGFDSSGKPKTDGTATSSASAAPKAAGNASSSAASSSPALAPEGGTRVITKDDDGKTVTRNIQLFSMSEDDSRYLGGLIAQSHIKPEWLKTGLAKAFNDPERYFALVFGWGHRLALLLLPIIGLLLAMLYMGKKYKRFFLYDHLLVSMNLLSFIFLTNAVAFLLPHAAQPATRGILFLWTLANFFLTLRGAYGSSILGAIVKSLILWITTWISFGLILTLVMFVSLTNL